MTMTDNIYFAVNNLCLVSWEDLAVSILLYRASFVERFLQVWLQAQYKNIVQQNFKLF